MMKKTKLESSICGKDLRSWRFLVWRGKAEEKFHIFKEMKDEEVHLLFSLLTTHRMRRQAAARGSVKGILPGRFGRRGYCVTEVGCRIIWRVDSFSLRDTVLLERTRRCWKWDQGRCSRKVSWVKNKKQRLGFPELLSDTTLRGRSVQLWRRELFSN